MLRRQTAHFVTPQFHASLSNMFCSDIRRDFAQAHNRQVHARNIGISRQLSHRLPATVEVLVCRAAGATRISCGPPSPRSNRN
jgi:hypothetical protein